MTITRLRQRPPPAPGSGLRNGNDFAASETVRLGTARRIDAAGLGIAPLVRHHLSFSLPKSCARRPCARRTASNSLCWGWRYRPTRTMDRLPTRSDRGHTPRSKSGRRAGPAAGCWSPPAPVIRMLPDSSDSTPVALDRISGSRAARLFSAIICPTRPRHHASPGRSFMSRAWIGSQHPSTRATVSSSRSATRRRRTKRSAAAISGKSSRSRPKHQSLPIRSWQDIPGGGRNRGHCRPRLYRVGSALLRNRWR
jgi:hypothetical protein